jgi:MinD-like ATPase involved in chromosome partitioning or flagellar assembly
MRGKIMVRYDFPTKNNNQHENLRQDFDDYIETSVEPFDSQISAAVSAEIELEMAETVYEMRREFKRANKRIRQLYSTKEPRRKKYDTTRSTRLHHISKRRAVA